MSTFRSVFADHLTNYVRTRRQLGLRFDTQEGILRTFDRHVSERDYHGFLSEELALEFATSTVRFSA